MKLGKQLYDLLDRVSMPEDAWPIRHRWLLAGLIWLAVLGPPLLASILDWVGDLLFGP